MLGVLRVGGVVVVGLESDGVGDPAGEAEIDVEDDQDAQRDEHVAGTGECGDGGFGRGDEGVPGIAREGGFECGGEGCGEEVEHGYL